MHLLPQVYQLEEKWRDTRSLQRFLYLVSPMSWRREHDHIHCMVLDPKEAASASSTLMSRPRSRTLSKASSRRHSRGTQATVATLGTQGTQCTQATFVSTRLD